MMMKQLAILHKIFLLVVMVGWSIMGHAQRYVVQNGRIYFGHEPVIHADVQSFVDLGNGYAKDQNSVYMNGLMLENADPSTFRLKDRSSWRKRESNEDEYIARSSLNGGFAKDSSNGYYCGERVNGSIGSSFKNLGGGYAKDSSNGYYCGERVNGSIGSSFEYLGNGYAKDSFNGYYCGERVNGSIGSSFEYLGNGYAKDSFNGYYCGEKVNGSIGSSFKNLGGGYAKDSFNGYYCGKKVNGSIGSSFEYLGE